MKNSIVLLLCIFETTPAISLFGSLFWLIVEQFAILARMVARGLTCRYHSLMGRSICTFTLKIILKGKFVAGQSTWPSVSNIYDDCKYFIIMFGDLIVLLSLPLLFVQSVSSNSRQLQMTTFLSRYRENRLGQNEILVRIAQTSTSLRIWAANT